MATTLTNPAATQGMDFGGLLSQVLSTYTEISKARIEKDTVKYAAAAQMQQQTFNPPQSTGGMLDALGIGNARVPGTNSNGVASSGGLNLPMVGVLGVAAVAGFFVLKKVIK